MQHWLKKIVTNKCKIVETMKLRGYRDTFTCPLFGKYEDGFHIIQYKDEIPEEQFYTS